MTISCDWKSHYRDRLLPVDGGDGFAQYRFENKTGVGEVTSCMTVAAVRCHREQVGGTRVALVISGGNINGAVLDEVLRKY